MLPIPQTTHISPTFEMGCMTWAWCPTMRSTAPGTAARASATVCWASTTPWAYSLPQCIDTTTSSAPAARAACASARITAGSIWSTSHGLSLGSAYPLNPYAYDSCATAMPSTSYRAGVASSSADRAVPACCRPASSSAVNVATTPCSPKSSAWLDDDEQPSNPALARFAASVRGARNRG